MNGASAFMRTDPPLRRGGKLRKTERKPDEFQKVAVDRATQNEAAKRGPFDSIVCEWRTSMKGVAVLAGVE